MVDEYLSLNCPMYSDLTRIVTKNTQLDQHHLSLSVRKGVLEE